MIKDHIAKLQGKIVSIAEVFAMLQKDLYSELDKEINKLMIELETGGNIRF